MDRQTREFVGEVNEKREQMGLPPLELHDMEGAKAWLAEQESGADGVKPDGSKTETPPSPDPKESQVEDPGLVGESVTHQSIPEFHLTEAIVADDQK